MDLLIQRNQLKLTQGRNMRYSPGQFSSYSSPKTPSIGGGTYTPVNPQPYQSYGPYVTPKLNPTPLAPQPITPPAVPASPFTGSAPSIPQVNPYGVNNGNGYYHASNRWSGRQVMDRPNPVTRIDGNPVPLPAHATAGSTPRRPIILEPGRGGTSQDTPNPGSSSVSAGNTALGVSGSGSGKMASSTTGLRGI